MASFFQYFAVGVAGLISLFVLSILKKLGIVGVLDLYITKKNVTAFLFNNSTTSTKKVTNLKKSCISIPSPGGFDQLCRTDAPYGVIGANVTGIKPGILTQPITKYNANITKDLIQVEVHAFGLNYADCVVRWGLYVSAKKYVGWPITPGFEFSGKVKWIGDDKNSIFNIGDEVHGVTLFGGYCTEITVPEHQLFPIPKEFTMSEAAGFLATAITAYYATFVLAAPTRLPHINKAIIQHTNSFYAKGTEEAINDDKLCGVEVAAQSVLIHSASGGVGSMLVQSCKGIAGFECVVGVVGGRHKVEIAKQNGCDIVIDRKSDRLKKGNIWDEMKERIPDFDGFDIVFDGNGVATLKQSYNHLKATGKLVSYGFHTMLPHSGWINPFQWIKVAINAFLRMPSFNPLHLVEQNKSVLAFNVSFLFSRKDLMKIGMVNAAKWIEDGLVKVIKVTEYKMKDVANAHRDIQSGKTIGKLVMITPHHADYDKL